jgi:S-phase kinase-associated protein 1
MSDPKDVQGLDDETEDMLKLQSSDLVTFEVPRKVAEMSELVKTMVEGDREATDIPLHNVKSQVLAKVVEYMRYHNEQPAKEIEKPLKSSNMTEVVSQWDAEFVDVEQILLFEMILAANYMDVKPLLVSNMYI